MSDYILSATLELKDKLTSKLSDSKKALEGVKASASGVSGALDTVQASMDKTGQSAAKATSGAEKLKNSLQGVKGSYSATLSVKDMASPAIRKVNGGIRNLSIHGNNITLTVTAEDKASPALSKVKSGLQGVKGKTAAAYVHLRDEASAGITHIKEELTSLTGKAYTAMVNVKQNTGGIAGLTEKAGNAVSGVASGMLMNTSMQMAGAAGIGFGIYDAIKSYADFEKEMSAVKAISGATGAEFDMLTEKARQMGADTKFSATESAQAFEYMAMAGWKTDDMMNGIEGVMNLAAASGEDLGRVSDIVTDALTAFGLKASDSAHFADVLAAAATSSNTNVGMMGETFKYVAPLAGALKYDVEDVATAIGVMANSGVKASEAGTSLRSIFTRLAKPPKDAAAALDALGISIKNDDGTIKPFMQTMEEMRDKFSGLTDDQKVQYAASIAGQEAMSGLLAIMNASEGDFEKVANAIDHANGSAEKMAKTRIDNLAGDIELVGGAWDQFIQTIMKGGTASGLRSIVQEIGSIMDLLNDRIKDGLDFGDVFAIAGKGITDLKNKFLQFDGVGSILAGGALAAGLYKIIGLTKRASSAIGDLMSKRKGGTAGAAGAPATRDMVINAANVVVNGKNIAGGGAATSRSGGTLIFGPDGKPISSDKYAPAPTRSWKNLAKEAAAGGAVAAIMAGLDIYSTVQSNNAAMKEAQENVKYTAEHLEEIKNSDSATARQVRESYADLTKAQQYQAAVARDNRERVGKSIGSASGAVIGSAIGSLGGPIGMVAGGIIGEIVGNKIGGWMMRMGTPNELNKDMFTLEKATAAINGQKNMPTYFDQNGKSMPYDFSSTEKQNYDMQQNRDSFGISTDDAAYNLNLARQSQDVAPSTQTPNELQITSNATAAESTISVWSSALDTVKGFWDNIVAGIEQDNEEIASSAQDSGAEVSASASDTADEVYASYDTAAVDTQSIWGPVAGWFESVVFGPTASGAADCGSNTSSSFASSASNSESAWGGVVGWFAANVWGPLVSGAQSCAKAIGDAISNAASAARGAAVRAYDYVTGNYQQGGSAAAIMESDDNYNIGPKTHKYFASGTSFAPGGWSEINEHGGEIVDLPTGARVYPHATTMRMLDDLFSGENFRPVMTPAAPVSLSVQAPAPSSNPPATINITGNSFLVREEADIDKIAYKLMLLMQQANANMNFVGEGAFV